MKLYVVSVGEEYSESTPIGIFDTLDGAKDGCRQYDSLHVYPAIWRDNKVIEWRKDSPNTIITDVVGINYYEITELELNKVDA